MIWCVFEVLAPIISIELTLEAAEPDLRTSAFDVPVKPPYLSACITMFENECIEFVTSSVVAVLPKTVNAFAAIIFPNIFAPIDNVCVGARLAIPECAVPEPTVRIEFDLIFSLKRIGTAALGSKVVKVPILIPPATTLPVTATFPSDTNTFGPVSSKYTFEPTDNVNLVDVFATPTLPSAYICPYT